MHLSLGIVLSGLLASSALAASPVVTENLTGIIQGSSTIDKKGYFGAPGADLSGAAVAIYLQYVPSLLGASQECRSHGCTYNQSIQLPDTPGAVLVTVLINGHRVVYAPAHEAAVFFGTQAPYQLTVDADASSGFGIGLRGVQLAARFSAAPVFGRLLSPGDGPVLASSPDDYVAFYSAVDQTPVEQLTYTPTKGSR